MLHPKKTKYRKHHRNRFKGIATTGNTIKFGDYALQACQPSWITSRQIEAGRRVLTRYVKKGGKLIIRIFPDKPVTKRPEGTRMGSGKGSPEYWVAVIYPGKILYEIGGINENAARQALKIASYKMPIKTRIIKKGF